MRVFLVSQINRAREKKDSDDRWSNFRADEDLIMFLR